MAKKITAFFLTLCIAAGLMVPLPVLADDDSARVVLTASPADKNGCFTMEMEIYNATFNAFQFVLWYDSTTVIPVDASGAATDEFSAFAQPMDDGWMATIGTGIDTQRSLIDFTGYVTPGQAVAVDRPEKTGVATVGESGLSLFTFRFRKTGDRPVEIALASQDSGHPSQPYLPEGGAVVDAGISAPVTLEFVYPQSVGESGETAVPLPGDGQTSNSGQQPESPATAEQLLDHSIILPIGSHAAVVEGGVTAIYPGEGDVVPFLQNNRTYVPVRFIAERMGAAVEWEQATRTVVIEKGGRTIRMPIGSGTYTIDGVSYEMDAAAMLTNNRTMVPIRFIADALGYQVEWDNGRRMVVIGDGAVTWDMADAAADTALEQAQGLLALYSSFV